MTKTRRMAVHEAGHAVAAYHLGLTICEIVMNQNPAYVSYEPGSTESNLLFTMAGPWDRIWKEGVDMAVVVRSHHYFVSSVERFLDVPEIWAQIAALAEVLMTVDRLDGKEVSRSLKLWKV